GPSGELEPGMLLIQLGDAIEHPEARPNGPLRVVAVGERSAEDRHDRVPDELLDRTAVLLDLLLGPAVIQLERVPHVLRIRAVRSRGEANQVHEEDGHELALFATRGGRAQLHPTGRTEPSLV